MTNTLDENAVKQRMDKALISYQNDLNTLRAGRASSNMLDQILVEAYGSKIPINHFTLCYCCDFTVFLEVIFGLSVSHLQNLPQTIPENTRKSLHHHNVKWFVGIFDL